MGFFLREYLGHGLLTLLTIASRRISGTLGGPPPCGGLAWLTLVNIGCRYNKHLSSTGHALQRFVVWLFAGAQLRLRELRRSNKDEALLAIYPIRLEVKSTMRS